MGCQPTWGKDTEGDLGRRAKRKGCPWHLGVSNLILGPQKGRTKLFRGGRVRSLVDSSSPTLLCLQAPAEVQKPARTKDRSIAS